ncbi:hypothetical protein ABH925_007364 [Streptacidiphilus sp. EB129]
MLAASVHDNAADIALLDKGAAGASTVHKALMDSGGAGINSSRFLASGCRSPESHNCATPHRRGPAIS